MLFPPGRQRGTFPTISNGQGVIALDTETAALQLPRSRGPVRLLVGSLIAGAGLTVLGFLLGGSPASADEQAPPAPLGTVASSVAQSLDSTVSGVTQGVGSTVSKVTAAVVPAVPDPVQQVVSEVVAPVVDTVSDVAAQAPVAAVTTPVTNTVDEVVASTPVV